MESVWINDLSRPTFNTLKGDISTDVLIIGGGITGILCSYMLRQSGVKNIVVEADRICGGVTQNTTAKITYQHGLVYQKIIKKYGAQTAKMYLDAQTAAISQFEKLYENIDCDYKRCNSFVYSLTSREKIEREVAALNRIGAKAYFSKKTQLPFFIEGAVCAPEQAQFHPLKFLFSICKDLEIYENTKVTEFKDPYVITNNGKISAKKIIVATHFPLINKHGAYFLKMYQHRSYVMALDNAPVLKDMYVDEALSGLSFRSYNNTLLLGIGGHRTGKNGVGYKELEKAAKMYYPTAIQTQWWATQDCMTLDSIAYIGQYSNNTPNLYVATGFNKWGMTSAMVAAMILSDLCKERENKFARVFAPSRTILHTQLAINSAETLINLLNFTKPRCPHLGCALKYNKQEHSWDCACHGSRFGENGKLLNGPASDDIRL